LDIHTYFLNINFRFLDKIKKIGGTLGGDGSDDAWENKLKTLVKRAMCVLFFGEDFALFVHIMLVIFTVIKHDIEVLHLTANFPYQYSDGIQILVLCRDSLIIKTVDRPI